MYPAPVVRSHVVPRPPVAALVVALLATLSGCQSGSAKPSQPTPPNDARPENRSGTGSDSGKNTALAVADHQTPEVASTADAPASESAAVQDVQNTSTSADASAPQAPAAPSTSNRVDSTKPKPQVAIEDLPDAEEILDAFVEALGGYATFNQLKNRVMTGHYLLGDTAARVVVYEAAPNKSYVYTHWPNGMSSEVWTDGDIVWDRGSNGATRLRVGSSKDDQIFRSHFNRESKWQELHLATDVVGTAERDGQSYYKVLVEPLIGGKETWFINKATKLHERSEAQYKPHPSAMEVAVETTFSDYRKVDGVLRYHKLEQVMGFSSMTVTYDMMKYNIDLDERIFQLPKEIQALIDSGRGMGVVEPGRSRLIPADPRFDPVSAKPAASEDNPAAPVDPAPTAGGGSQ